MLPRPGISRDRYAFSNDSDNWCVLLFVYTPFKTFGSCRLPCGGYRLVGLRVCLGHSPPPTLLCAAYLTPSDVHLICACMLDFFGNQTHRYAITMGFPVRRGIRGAQRNIPRRRNRRGRGKKVFSTNQPSFGSNSHGRNQYIATHSIPNNTLYIIFGEKGTAAVSQTI